MFDAESAPEARDETTGLSLHVRRDDDPEDPRTGWDHLCRMVCWHGRYTIGDRHSWGDPDDFRREMKGEPHMTLPLYLYDHSGLTIRTTPFHCPWDSGQIGWIVVTLEEIRKEYRVKRVSKRIRRQVEDLMRAEVAEYDMYLRGDVWCVHVEDDDGDIVDSCGGYFGHDYALGEGREMLADAVAVRREADAVRVAAALTESRPDLYGFGHA